MQNKTEESDPVELAQRILRYLQTNPDAKDTLEGIAEWWLLQGKIAEAVEQVSKAIAWLIANGYLLERQVPGSKTIYEINPANQEEISKFLRKAHDFKFDEA